MGGLSKNMVKVKVLVTQLCPNLCDPVDCSPPGSSVHGVSQAKILEWVVIPFSRGSSWPRNWTQVSLIVGSFFTIWATREAQRTWYLSVCNFVSFRNILKFSFWCCPLPDSRFSVVCCPLYQFMTPHPCCQDPQPPASSSHILLLKSRKNEEGCGEERTL